ncbi:diphthamide synthesis protein, partial [Candidatus Woesearchaeota archaeon]|nr:diphthamide synthesis protein [Candidatus Woesearchaeota archaeon]
MDTLFIKAEYTGKVELCNDALDYLRKKKYSRIAMYASIQFVNKLEIVKKQLAENNIAIITSKPDRANAVSQLVGCDNYHHSLNLKEEELTEIEAYLYIGDGKFHP